jgi:hypothetical protein
MNRDEMIEYLENCCVGKNCIKCRLENHLDCEFDKYNHIDDISELDNIEIEVIYDESK